MTPLAHKSLRSLRLASFRSHRKHFTRAAFAALISALSLPLVSSRAATLTWDPGTPQVPVTGTFGSGSWDATTTDWSNGTTDQAFVTGSTAAFGGVSTGTATVTLNSPISALAADFTSPGYSIVSSTTNMLTLTSAGGVGAASAIYANGTGGTTTFTGPVTFGAGAETVTANTATDVINFGGTIAQTTPGTATLTTAGLGTINYSGTSFVPGKFNINNAVFNSSGTATIANQTYFGTDSATGATLNITGGTFTATAVTTFVGATGAAGTVNISGGTNSFAGLNVGNGFNGTGDGTGTVTISGGTNTASGLIRLGSTDAGVGTLNLNTGGRLTITTTAGAIVRGTGASGTGGSGTINFNGGVLQYNAAPAVPAIAANIGINILDNGATISTNGSNITIASPIGHGGTAAIDGGLTKAANAGILTLTGVSTYTGATTVGAGTLAVSGSINGSNMITVTAGALTLSNTAAAVLSDTGTLSLANGTALNLNAAAATSETIGSLVLGGTTEATGTYTAAQLTALDNGITFSSLNGETLTVGAVPEPSTWACGVIMFAAAGWKFRRRLTRRAA